MTPTEGCKQTKPVHLDDKSTRRLYGVTLQLQVTLAD